ncbi:hypothetical protein BC833DRAFT_576842, partial [Globomyces pollinis-pini]
MDFAEAERFLNSLDEQESKPKTYSKSSSKSHSQSYSKSVRSSNEKSTNSHKAYRTFESQEKYSSHNDSEREYSHPGEPNQTVLLQGISYSTMEATIEKVLYESNALCESSRLIRDRDTGKSKGYAFVNFPSTEVAEEWVNNHLPTISIDGFPVRIEYSKPPTTDVDDWECVQCGGINFKRREACYRCRLPKMFNYEVEEKLVNDGTTDIGSIPSNYLLFQGLDPLTTNEIIYETVSKIIEINTVRLVKDRSSNLSWGYAFIECKDIDNANYLLGLIYNSQKPKPLYINEKLITVSYAHMGAFIPVYSVTPYIAMTKIDDFGKKSLLSYWDEGAYCKPYPPLGPEDETSIPITLPEVIGSNNSVTSAPKPKTKEPSKEAVKPKLLEKKRKAVPISNKMTVQLEKWSTKKKELEEEPDIQIISDDMLIKKLPSDSAINEEYSDLDKIACLLCKRKFKSVTELQKHHKKSQLHKDNIETLRTKQLAQLRERLANQQQAVAVTPNKKQKSIPEAKPQKIHQPTRHGIQADNIGNQLLTKMGWKKGEGLGADKDGIVKPIQPKVLKKGAGLGSNHPFPKK